MSIEEALDRAVELFSRAYHAQQHGQLDQAIELYRQSIAAHPTAEAHTFLGWSYSMQGRLEEAIAECQEAIAVDPDFGNPYNDIGAYLMELGRPEEAVPWLEQATRAPRYDPRHFPHLNLGRAFVALEQFSRALAEFEQALAIDPDCDAARQAIARIRRTLN